jgi:hypothetical protein
MIFEYNKKTIDIKFSLKERLYLFFLGKIKIKYDGSKILAENLFRIAAEIIKVSIEKTDQSEKK